MYDQIGEKLSSSFTSNESSTFPLAIIEGEGNSDKPDGIQEVQIGTEIAVAAALIDNLPSLLTFGKIVGVAHAHGRYDYES
jgi:hypothetical protein